MYRKRNSKTSILSFSLPIAIACIVMIVEGFGLVRSYPSASVDLFSHTNKLENKLTPSEESAEQSFQHFIQSKPDSTIIGEIKPNSSELDMMLLRSKIADTILSMQETETASRGQMNGVSSGGDCFIEVTRVERVLGKCHKVNNGLPICQSNNYMAINTDCS